MKIFWQGDASLSNALAGVEAAISDYGFEDKFKKGVAVALSGGADSVFLLICMKKISEQLSFPLCALHVNHHIRAEEAERDAEFCRNLCSENNIEFHLFEADVLSLAKKDKIGVEEAARNVRYSFFNKFISENPKYTYIVTAHNATDNAETVIFNMLRGGAGRAMRGIPPERSNILRPLLYVSKADIVNALENNNISYVFDSTNNDTSYSRNFIRKEIIPKCSHINTSFESAIQRLNKNMRNDMDFFDEYVKEFCERNEITEKSKKDVFKNLHAAILSRVIIYMYSFLGNDLESLSYSHIEKIMEIINKENNIGMTYSLPCGIDFVCDRKYYKFKKAVSLKDKSFCVELNLGENRLPNSHAIIYLTNEKNDQNALSVTNVYKLSIQANLTSAKINGKIFARNRRDGDFYRYGKMTRKLKKLFNDAKLSQEEKQTIPVICDSDGILWVPGFSVRDSQKTNTNNETIELYAYYCHNGGNDE